ncbi:MULTISPECIES: hypothetical protein [unclassified Streptomyces]|uniref:hypothetical protein n=1 Tax=unclassified Streptomyces TaxID=2593676 RepID=UPI000DC7E1A9|nr:MULTISPECIES: hypothetical protein [unclassified Streptomyces]AWZ06697.1 hypothetical protein DRB89_21065 [Streptomyces sp. ICC4]AWZ15232.1 hypothetical protein DRB96_26600 [Streptomyces sp. ICC1]
MRSLSLHDTVRSVLRAGSVPALLLAATAAAAAGSGAHAADGPTAALGTPSAVGPEFQYLGTDDRPHGFTAPKGCLAAKGGGGRAVTNKTRGPVALYREPGCAGSPVQVLAPGAVTPVRPYFASARFGITG